MQVEVKEESKVIPFPKYMISTKETIIFFHNEKSGMVIHAGKDKSVYVGEYSNDWNYTIFTDFKGSITITQ